jgi:sulfur-oxidizing protein SoxY
MTTIFRLQNSYFNLFFAVLFVFINIGAVAKDKPPEPVTWNSYLKEAVFGEDIINDGSHMFSLDTPYRALDAAIVPITINFSTPQSDKYFVKSLTLIVDENPSPLVSKFNFTPKIGNASLTTRVRIDKYTYVRAVVEMNNGEKYMNSNFVKAAGGCSAPSLADKDAVMARLGKMKMKFFETGNSNSLSKAQFLISHPNYSGLQFNQLTRAEIPAHFVNYIKIEQDNELILEAYPDISLSEDPAITFYFHDSGSPLKVTVEDSEGKNYAGDFPLSSVVSKKF